MTWRVECSNAKVVAEGLMENWDMPDAPKRVEKVAGGGPQDSEVYIPISSIV